MARPIEVPMNRPMLKHWTLGSLAHRPIKVPMAPRPMVKHDTWIVSSSDGSSD
jgi:hypothetical protein